MIFPRTREVEWMKSNVSMRLALRNFSTFSREFVVNIPICTSACFDELKYLFQAFDGFDVFDIFEEFAAGLVIEVF